MTKSYRYRGLSGVLHIIVNSTQISLWGVEANYPGSDNAHLTEAADELLADAILIGLRAAQRLCATLARLEART